MSTHDVYLLSPELALAALAILTVILDLLIKRKIIVAIVAILGLVVPIALMVVLLVDVVGSGPQPGIFGTFMVDRFALFFKFLVVGIVGLVMLASIDYMENLERCEGEYFGLLLFSASGMMLLTSTTEFISIYISLELATLPLVALAAFLSNGRSTEASIKFLILSGISSALLLYGMALVFGFTGSTYLKEIGTIVSNTGVLTESPALLLGIVLMVAGFGFKISAVPFQMWVPDVYEGSPTPVVAFLSVASKAAAFAILLRIFYVAFPMLNLDWGMLFAVLAVASMTVGNLVAISQTNIKRLLGYSTIAHAGYLLVGLAAVSARASGEATLGPSSLLFYLGAYAATNLAAFFAIIVIAHKNGSEQIGDLAGMAQRAPILALCLTVAMVALIGLPPTGLFFGKLYIFVAAINSDLLWLAIIGVINSVISAYYYLKVVRVMYLEPAQSLEFVPSSVSMRVALGIAVLGIIALGVIPGPLLRIAESAVKSLV